ncbi:MAG TPA: hypothetical protein VIY27_12470 [Myxococcota bacterium]
MIDSRGMALDESKRTHESRVAASGAAGSLLESARGRILLLAGFLLLALILYRPALRGPFVSDDIAYLVTHPYTKALSLENLLAIFDPRGPARFYTANYEPVHLLLGAVERHIFADATPGYHLVNVAVHALVAVLLLGCLLRVGVWPWAALFGGIFFLVHPANVEAVAWASQLKSCAALAFALGALLALPRAPLASTLLFALSLLTKATGFFALPAAAAAHWAQRRRGGDPCARGRWLVAWLGIALLYAVPQLGAFAHLGAADTAVFDGPWAHLRGVAALGMRYALMAATAHGVSAFQEPDLAVSWLDPYWLAAIPTAGLLVWRCVATLRRGSPEAACWVAAAAAFAPVSQILPFATPMADRYLYFILPGLIGGALLWAQALWVRLLRRPDADGGFLRRASARALGVLCALGLAAFAWQSTERAALWRSETLLLVDAARHHPDGVTAHFLRARSAAQAGDARTAVAALQVVADRGLDRFMAVRDDPGLAPLRGDPGFQRVIREMAGRWIARAQARGYTTQPELRVLGLAHLERQEYAAAVAAFEASLRAGGPLDDAVRAELAALRARLGDVPGTGDPGAAP